MVLKWWTCEVKIANTNSWGCTPVCLYKTNFRRSLVSFYLVKGLVNSVSHRLTMYPGWVSFEQQQTPQCHPLPYPWPHPLLFHPGPLFSVLDPLLVEASILDQEQFWTFGSVGPVQNNDPVKWGRSLLADLLEKLQQEVVALPNCIRTSRMAIVGAGRSTLMGRPHLTWLMPVCLPVVFQCMC